MTDQILVKTIRNDFARANNYIKKAELIRGIKLLIDALIEYQKIKLDYKRAETEYIINGALNNMCIQKDIFEVFSDIGMYVPRLTFKKSNISNLIKLLSAIEIKLINLENQKIINKEKTKEELLISYFGQAILDLKNHNYPAARVRFRRYINENKDKKVSLKQVIAYLEAQDKTDLSVEFFEMGMQQFPKDAVFVRSAINYAIKYGDIKKLEAYYTHLFKNFGLNSNTLLHKAKSLIKIGKKQNAVQSLLDAVQLDKHNAEAQVLLDDIQSKSFSSYGSFNL